MKYLNRSEDSKGQMFVLVNYMYADEAHQSEIMNDTIIVRKSGLGDLNIYMSFNYSSKMKVRSMCEG